MNIELVCGYIGSICLVCLLLPQIKHILETKDASGTTWGFIGIELIISSTYIVYGVSITCCNLRNRSKKLQHGIESRL